MRRMFVLLMMALTVLAVMPIETQAQVHPGNLGYWPLIQRAGQQRQQGRYNRPVRHVGNYEYVYYDPATIQQMLSLPDGLAACQVDFSTARVTTCHSIVKTAEAIEMYTQNPDGILGTVHVEKGAFHFHPFDNTNTRIGTGAGGALGVGGGAAIGGAYGGRKGAAVGAIAGGIIGGLLGSRRSHNGCLKIEPETAQSVGLTSEITSNQEQQALAPIQPVAGPANPLAGITWLTVNTTSFRAVVTDPNNGERKLIPAGGSVSLPDPTGDQAYTVVLIEPGRGKSNQIPGEIRPSADLQGWEIWAR